MCAKAVHNFPLQVRQRPRLGGVLPAEQLHGGPGVGVPVGGGRPGRVLARPQGLQPAADQHARGRRRAPGQSVLHSLDTAMPLLIGYYTEFIKLHQI